MLRDRGRLGLTRAEIAERLPCPIQSVCGLIRAMLDDGEIIETAETRPTPTGCPAAVLIAAGVAQEGQP